MPKHIVILGGGIIGCTTAYYIAHHPLFSSSGGDKITLIEASKQGCAQGASGKAGGLVARWAYPKEIVNVSFDEHVKLAEKHNGKDRWGWRYVGCGSWEGKGEVVEEKGPETGSIEEAERRNKSLEKELGLPGGQKPVTGAKKRENGLPSDLLWVKDELTRSYSPMAPDGDTAQVHPYYFTTSMLALAKEAGGVEEITGRAYNITSENGAVTGVEYIVTEEDGQEASKRIPATHIVVAAGAWSTHILPGLPIAATRAHSITIRPQKDVEISPYVLFTEIDDPISGKSRAHSSPEIYARPDGEVYACGPGDDEPLPQTVDGVKVESASCDLLFQRVSSISQQLREGTVEKRQACYLPSVSTGGGPIIGEALKIAKGLYIGTGHTCWGISNGPGTARALSELILDGKVSCANLKKLQPSVLL